MSRKHADTVIPEAVRWFNRFRMKGPTALSPDESESWARWSADATHLAEFNRMKRVWKQLGTLSGSPRPVQQDLEADKYAPTRSISEWLARAKPKPPRKPKP